MTAGMNSSCPDRGFSCGRYRAIVLIFCFPSAVVIELASNSSCESVNCWNSCDGIIGIGLGIDPPEVVYSETLFLSSIRSSNIFICALLLLSRFLSKSDFVDDHKGEHVVFGLTLPLLIMCFLE